MLCGPQAILFLAAALLSVVWLGPAAGLLLLPLVLTVFLGVRRNSGQSRGQDDHGDQAEMLDELDRLAAPTRREGRQLVCLVLQLEGLGPDGAHTGRDGAARITTACLDRFGRVLRPEDRLFDLGGGRFGAVIVLSGQSGPEAPRRLAERLLDSLDPPLPVGAFPAGTGVSIGLCTGGAGSQGTGQALFEAALSALAQARRSGRHGEIRVFGEAPLAVPSVHADGADGEPRQGTPRAPAARFQPQISARTGRLGGFDAQAQYADPSAPATGGPAQDHLMHDALEALTAWDALDLPVPRITVPLRAARLGDPLFANRLDWELDRCGIAPERLGFRLTGASDGPSPDILKTLLGLSRRGCVIELDALWTEDPAVRTPWHPGTLRLGISGQILREAGAGQGHRDRLGAILSRAADLGAQTLARDVRTATERETLARLGCDHVQGDAIASAMPLAAAAAWITAGIAAAGGPEPGIPPRNTGFPESA